MPDGDSLTFDNLVENHVSEDVRKTIPDSWHQKYKGKPVDLVIQNALSSEQEVSRRVRIPDDQSTDADRRKFYSRCGCPETPDGYELEGSEAFVGWARENFHSLGIPKGAAHKLVKGYNEFVTNQKADHDAKQKADYEKDFGEKDGKLHTDWGESYEANLGKANEFYAKLFGDDVAILIQEKELHNHPTFVKRMFDLSAEHGEGSFLKSGGSGKGKTAEQRLEQMYPDN